MNVGIGTVSVQFLSWECLFRIFGIVTLQCRAKRMEETNVKVVVIKESSPNYHFLFYLNMCQLRKVEGGGGIFGLGMLLCMCVSGTSDLDALH
jgi:hypothetical protein